MKKQFYAIALTALVLSSCTTGGVTEKIDPANQETPLVNFSASVTKATESAFVKGDMIGIYGLTSGTTIPAGIFNGYANFKYEAYNDKGFQPFDETFKMYFPADVTSKLDFVSYYPYSDAAVTAGHKISLDIKNQDVATNNNLLAMYSDNAKGLDKNSTSVALNFRFMISKLVLTLETGTGITDATLLEGATLEVKNAKTTATVDLANLTFENYGGETEVISGLVSSADRKIVLYLLPHGENTGIEMIFTDKAGAKYYYYLPAAHTFEPSKQYNYALKMNKTIVDAIATIQPWTPGDDRTGEGDQQ